MNSREKKLLTIALLLTGAAGGGYWYYNLESAEGPAAAAKKDDSAPIPPPVSIGLRFMESGDGGGKAVNLFNYRREELEEAPPPPEQPFQLVTAPPPPVVPQPRNLQPAGPAVPAEPPVVNVPLAYSGFARDENDEMIAFLETNGTGAPAGHYNLREDDFLLGRFRVMKISADTVEVEDMDRPERSANRKQTLSIKK
jgi:hypothetical protein